MTIPAETPNIKHKEVIACDHWCMCDDVAIFNTNTEHRRVDLCQLILDSNTI